jgi:NADPH-dependent ferric siderophore reductase
MILSNSAAEIDPRQPQRVRHELRRRKLAVQAVENISPSMVRVTLSGPELGGFSSLGFDDHVKLLFPVAGPEGGDGEPQFAGRSYTARRYDAAAGTLVIDFALHNAGPATLWAEQAQPGQSLTIGGPRGSLVIPASYDWHLLVGDDTALPAIARQLEELPEGSQVVAVVEADSPADKLSFDTRTDASVHWVYRNGAEAGCCRKRSARTTSPKATITPGWLVRVSQPRLFGRSFWSSTAPNRSGCGRRATGGEASPTSTTISPTGRTITACF